MNYNDTPVEATVIPSALMDALKSESARECDWVDYVLGQPSPSFEIPFESPGVALARSIDRQLSGELPGWTEADGLLNAMTSEGTEITLETVMVAYTRLRQALFDLRGVDVSTMLTGIPLDTEGELLHPSQYVSTTDHHTGSPEFPMLEDLLDKPRLDRPWCPAVATRCLIPRLYDSFAIDCLERRTAEAEGLFHKLETRGFDHVFFYLETRHPGRILEFLGEERELPANLMVVLDAREERESLAEDVQALLALPCAEVGCIVCPRSGMNTEQFRGIPWIVVEAGYGPKAVSADLEVVERLWTGEVEGCRELFIQNLGATPTWYGHRFQFRDPRGSDWSKWPMPLRVRNLPSSLLEFRMDERQGMTSEIEALLEGLIG